MGLLHKLHALRLTIIVLLAIYAMVVMQNQWDESCAQLCFKIAIVIFCFGLIAVGFITGMLYKERGLGAEFGAKWGFAVGGTVVALSFFFFWMDYEISSVIMSVLFAIIYGFVGAGIGLVSGLVGGLIGGEVISRGYLLGWL